MNHLFSWILLLYFFLLPGGAFSNSRVLVLNTSNDCPNATISFDGIADLIVKEAFRRLNVHIRQIRLFSERAISNANEGIDDGNYTRVKGLEKTYPNLIRVPEGIIRFEFVAFSREKNISIKSWNSLGPYNIAIIRGWKILEKNINWYKTLVFVNDEDQLFKMLDSKRVDIIVYDKIQGYYMINKFNYNSVHKIGRPLAMKEMYLYLHKRHARLVPMIALTLKQMKRDGTFSKIRRKVEKKYLKINP